MGRKPGKSKPYVLIREGDSHVSDLGIRCNEYSVIISITAQTEATVVTYDNKPDALRKAYNVGKRLNLEVRQVGQRDA